MNAFDTGLAYDRDEAVRHIAAADPVMRRLVEAAAPCTLTASPAAPFAALLRSIVYQQLSGRVAAAIHGRVAALLPADPEAAPAAVGALPDEALRAAGLSAAKTRALRDLAARTLDGTVPPLEALQELPDEEIIARLTQVRGVGRWTVQMLLIFTLGRPDVWPTADLGVRHGYALAYGLDAPAAPRLLDAAGAPLRPYRSVAAWHLWRAVDLYRASGSGL